MIEAQVRPFLSLPSRGARVEIYSSFYGALIIWSLPSRGARVEILVALLK